MPLPLVSSTTVLARPGGGLGLGGKNVKSWPFEAKSAPHALGRGTLIPPGKNVALPCRASTNVSSSESSLSSALLTVAAVEWMDGLGDAVDVGGSLKKPSSSGGTSFGEGRLSGMLGERKGIGELMAWSGFGSSRLGINDRFAGGVDGSCATEVRFLS